MRDIVKSATSTKVVWFVGMQSNQFPGNTLKTKTLEKLHLSAGIGLYKNLLLDLFTSASKMAKLQNETKHIWLNETFSSDLQKNLTIAIKAAGEIRDTDRLVCINTALFPANPEAFVSRIAKGLATPLNVAYIRKSTTSSNPNTISQIFISGSSFDIKGLITSSPLQCVECANEDFHDWFRSDDAILIFNTEFTARHFNSISIGRSGYFVKRSVQKEKMQAEHAYLTNLPAAVRPFFPQCGDYLEEDSHAAYEIEKIPFLDVSKLLVNGYFSVSQNSLDLMNQVRLYLEAKPKEKVNPEDVKKNLNDLFIEKTKKRLNQLFASSHYSLLDAISKQQCHCSIKEVGERYIRHLTQMISHQKSDLIEFAHGDLFFGNMLYEPMTQRLKLIDPRGGALMPLIYDIAKLSHSALGLYDLMVYGLLKIELKDDIRYALVLSQAQELGLSSLQQSFLELVEELHLNLSEVRLYEGALFLSMLPLHADSPKRQACQLLRAIELLEFFEGK